jgi:hypothetical protein
MRCHDVDIASRLARRAFAEKVAKNRKLVPVDAREISSEVSESPANRASRDAVHTLQDGPQDAQLDVLRPPGGGGAFFGGVQPSRHARTLSPTDVVDESGAAAAVYSYDYGDSAHGGCHDGCVLEDPK